MKRILILAPLLLSLNCFSVFAFSLKIFGTPVIQGIYLDAGSGVGTISCKNCGINGNTVTHTHSAHNFELGYQFNPYVALALGTSVLQPFSVWDIITPSLTVTPTSQTVDLAIKGMLPIANRISLFGKLGNGVIWLPNRKDENTAFSREVLYVASGVAWQATHKVSAAISYNHYAADHLVIDSGMLSANILF
jgi:hypothetical protein